MAGPAHVQAMRQQQSNSCRRVVHRHRPRHPLLIDVMWLLMWLAQAGKHTLHGTPCMHARADAAVAYGLGILQLSALVLKRAEGSALLYSEGLQYTFRRLRAGCRPGCRSCN